MCAPNPDSCGGTGGCSGATAEIAFEYVTNSIGLLQEFQYPYTSYYGKDFVCTMPEDQEGVAGINGYVQLPTNNMTALMNAIATVGPVAVSVDASAWSAYSSGVFNGCNQKNPDIDHAVVLVGYGEEKGQKYWLVRNSWSPNWGEQGYIKVARMDNEEEICGSDITPQVNYCILETICLFTDVICYILKRHCGESDDCYILWFYFAGNRILCISTPAPSLFSSIYLFFFCVCRTALPAPARTSP